MTTLANAPLIEVITELRWGKIFHPEGEGSIAFQFSEDERNFFPGQFKSEAKQRGFNFHEAVNPNIPLPHLVKHRFRREANTWPCFQIGDGIFTVNQTNDGYAWNTYKEAFSEGLAVLDKSHPDTLVKLPLIGIELRYRDAFFLNEGESSANFLRNKFNFDFVIPEQFLASDLLEKEILNNNFSFAINSKSPVGIVVVDVKEAIINGKPGFIMDIIMRSADEKAPKSSSEDLVGWLEEAHVMQQHAFKTLVKSEFAETFK